MTSVPKILVRVPRAGGPSHIGKLIVGDWSVPCTIGAGGLVQTSYKREGDKRTPIGVFPLRYGLFDPVAAPNFPRDLAFPFVPLSDAMIWEEEGPDYNRLVFSEDDERADERLTRRRQEGLFEVIVPIGFNDAVAERGRGSAIFIHAARTDMSGTAGCIGIPREHMLEFSRRLQPGMLIDIDYEESADRVRLDPETPLETIRFTGLVPGPKLIVVGAVHGNETCGPQAILRAIGDCHMGRLSVRRGEVTFLPVANMKAYRQNTREGDRNLNRDLREKTIPEDYEDRVGNRICSLLREHDVLLDIHSFRGEGEPFVFAGPPNNTGPMEPFRHATPEGEFAARLGTSIVIHGWLDIYARFLKERERLGLTSRTISEGVGTTEYMRFSGGYGVTLECGSHDDPRAVEIGYSAIVRALAHLRMIDSSSPSVTVETVIRVADVLVCEAKGDCLEGTWKTGDRVAAGQIIARRASGEVLNAPTDGFIIFPNHTASSGDGLCYFGVASDRARRADIR
ncbi:L,D-transpeptidase family protein [Microvirga splendida]|uniref:Succinylglutamate desuccinylase/aspartoacylase family protein n=1 Tax=Microvirga splendida TaxID=2795727 RepID=A0ABS0Y626_9HYPH|nr:succinylglutamate desuccinylase/aspartoacylase family protein [Microvirga splendida]MBJ6127747.1 succinylglutamate desuccinylase/aspartoacylase family protein [Microvirga splendida]